MILKVVRMLSFLIFLCCVPSGLMFAEGEVVGANGTINGTVKDTTGAVLQGAQIVLAPSGATVASDSQGAFSIRDVVPGSYTVTISYVGFSKFTSTVAITPEQTVILNATFSASKKAQSVTV